MSYAMQIAEAVRQACWEASYQAHGSTAAILDVDVEAIVAGIRTNPPQEESR